MKRTIWFWLCFIIAIILAIYFSVRIVMTGLGRSDVSYVHNISITSDTANSDLSGIASAVLLPPGTTSYSIDLDEINARIGSVPGVRKSAVRRIPNGNLSIHVSMHRSVALWTDGEYYFPLSADGTIVNRPVGARTTSDIVFRGPVPSDIAGITTASQKLLGQVDYLEWIENRRWDLHTTGGITIMLPEQSPETAIGTILVLNKNHNLLSKSIKVIDMRDDARILVK
ncbi:MAG: hypothetical protein E7011_00740 [Alphaproteobacteria bacterium]|nr:hypothetical protein [Alphaproteobacteria bacterium]